MSSPGAFASRWWARGALAALALAAVLGHLPSLRHPHFEGDEVVFLFLAERLARSPLDYHLRGHLEGPPARRFIEDTWLPLYTRGVGGPERDRITRDLRSRERAEVLETPFGEPAYDPRIYARPIFFHPPLYPYALAIARALGGTGGAALLSALMHGATVALIGLLGMTLGRPAIGLLAALLTAIEPISWLCGSRLWIDGMLTALTTTAVLAAVRTVDGESIGGWFGAGLALGLAGVAKLSALLVLPAIVAVPLVRRRCARPGQVIGYAAGAALCVAPWLGLSRVANGQWLPDSHPTAWQVAHYPYLAQALGRPAHFYATGLLLVAPLLVCAPLALWRLRRDRWLWIPLAWALGFLFPLTLVGVAGQGFQLRYIAAAMPALCLMAAAGMAALPRWGWPVAAALGAATIATALSSAAPAEMAEPAPYFTERSLSAVGLDLRRIAPRLWRAP